MGLSKHFCMIVSVFHYYTRYIANNLLIDDNTRYIECTIDLDVSKINRITTHDSKMHYACIMYIQNKIANSIKKKLQMRM